jgi:holo-[acyl-carrier protein] synthase
VGIRTGIDTVAVASVRDALAAHGERYLDRVYTAAERAECTRDDGTVDPERLAARFAAKEAVVKALRAVGGGFAWTDVEVTSGGRGFPAVALTGPVLSLAVEQGFRECDVSLTHENGLATAVVVALTSP